MVFELNEIEFQNLRDLGKVLYEFLPVGNLESEKSLCRGELKG